MKNPLITALIVLRRSAELWNGHFCDASMVNLSARLFFFHRDKEGLFSVYTHGIFFFSFTFKWFLYSKRRRPSNHNGSFSVNLKAVVYFKFFCGLLIMKQFGIQIFLFNDVVMRISLKIYLKSASKEAHF